MKRKNEEEEGMALQEKAKKTSIGDDTIVKRFNNITPC